MKSLHATPEELTTYSVLAAASRKHPVGSREWKKLQYAVADQIVSCYTSRGRHGRLEDIHETRGDGSCRCGVRRIR